jgi:hypothetical protein
MTFALALWLGGCGDNGGIPTPGPTPLAPTTPTEPRLFVATSDYTTGGYATVDLSTGAVQRALGTVHSDAIARTAFGKVFVVNRLQGDNVQVIDPTANYATTRQIPLGPGSNPQDIAFVSSTRAFVSRYDASPGLSILDLSRPEGQEVVGSVDLGDLAEAGGDGFADPSFLYVAPDNVVWVAAQRVNRVNFPPTQPAFSLLVAVDGATGQRRDSRTIQLPATNPVSRVVDASGAIPGSTPGQLVVVGLVGLFGVNDGGIALIDLATGTTQLVATEAQLGGDATQVAVCGKRVIALLSDASYHSSIVSFSLDTANDGDVATSRRVLLGPTRDNDFINDVVATPIDGTCHAVAGIISLAPASAAGPAPGLWIVDAVSGQPRGAGPIDVGAPPYSLALR